MEKIIMNELLGMYVEGKLSETTGTDADAAYLDADKIIEQLKADVSRLGKDKALDDAISTAITVGLDYGFCDGVKVGLAIANAFASKIDVTFIQKVAKSGRV